MTSAHVLLPDYCVTVFVSDTNMCLPRILAYFLTILHKEYEENTNTIYEEMKGEFGGEIKNVHRSGIRCHIVI